MNKFWEHPDCLCPKLDNIDSYPHTKIVSLACGLHKPRSKFKMVLYAIAGALIFPIVIVSLAGMGTGMDAAGDYEYAEDFTYKAWNGYVEFFWRRNII